MSAASSYRRMVGGATSKYVGPPPLLEYRATSLPKNTTTVTSWTNTGSLGSAYDLVVPAGRNPPTYLPQGGKNYRGSVQFSPGQVLETLNQLPANLYGTQPRVFMARMYFPLGSGAAGGNGVNIFGAGVPSQGTLADCASIGANAIYIHQYFAQSEATAAVGLPRFGWAGYVFSTPDASYDNSHIGSATPTLAEWAMSSNGPSTRTNEVGINTGPSGLRLGGGYYQTFDLAQAGLTLEIDYFVVLAGVLTDAQLNSIMF